MGTLAMTDHELVEASRRGEHDAFGRLVARYQDVVWAVSFSSTGDRALGEDVAQETFIAAWRQLEQLRDTVQIRPWLCAIARNLARKAKRRTWREETTDVCDVGDPIADGNPFDATAQAQTEQVVRDALERVPDGYREVLVLYYRENRSIRDVAQTLGVSEAAVMQRLTRGRRYLADGVTDLVERSLRGAKPRRNIVAGVVGAIAGLAGASRVDASPPKGSTMLKFAIASAVLATAGGTAYVVKTNAPPAPQPTATAAAPLTAAAVTVPSRPSAQTTCARTAARRSERSTS
jgi:RNA polymerase sigma factor (sigma-70 family)